MKLRIENKSAIAVPVTAEGQAWAETIEPNGSALLDKPGGVWHVGVKPSVLENIKESLTVVVKVLTAFITKRSDVGGTVALEIIIGNDGTNGVRVIPGEVENEKNLDPGQTSTFVAVDYVELRELGGAPAQKPSPQ